jgi:hypothetical protein
MAIEDSICTEVQAYLHASLKMEWAWEAISASTKVMRQLAPKITKAMKAAKVDAVTSTGEYPERAIRRCPETGELTVLKMTRGYNVPLVDEDVFDKIPPIDPEPSLEEAIAEAQTHRTAWGEMMISPVAEINAGDFLDAFKVNLANNWTPPTDAELDAAAASGAVDDVFHADEEVE